MHVDMTFELPQLNEYAGLPGDVVRALWRFLEGSMSTKFARLGSRGLLLLLLFALFYCIQGVKKLAKAQAVFVRVLMTILASAAFCLNAILVALVIGQLIMTYLDAEVDYAQILLRRLLADPKFAAEAQRRHVSKKDDKIYNEAKTQ